MVVDGEYGFRMAAAVEWLLEKGYAVEVVSDDFYVGRGLVESGEMLWFPRVAGQGVVFHPRTVVCADGAAVTPRTLVCADRFSGKSRELAPVALVVPVLPDVPASGLYDVLSAGHAGVVRIGDARAPRLMGEAILDAHKAVLSEG